ncbi:hypothetical protein RB614_37810 [Phytohabitans sp. ZYX-F-186]|uniref:Ig-like domain-containing protein n=1 Tax=Phytohabitans maris TaxID=3071409 RepID=A0ABU0ZTZ1_9ACTN|nr:hypothetical protein [Phytohabitans sp. ZYX-F-186]MDQ7910266.1 hypothetical protein [Phytohabitans sp. ZYX-F-186]
MPELRAGTVITGTDVPTMVSAIVTGLESPTSTSFIAGSATCGVAFVAPTTGRVLIEWRANLDNSTNAFTIVAPEVRTGSSVGSGTVVLAASDVNALYGFGTNELGFGCFVPLDGLTPGESYNVRLMHRVTSGTGTIQNSREVIVLPLT